MKNFIRYLLALCTAALAACSGGGGDSGQSPFGDGGGGGDGTTVITVADVLLDLSKATVANTGSDSVILTVTALDAQRNTVSGATIQVTADSEAIVTTPSTKTGDDGKLQSTLTIGSNRSNRTITVSVASGTATRSATIQVFGAQLSSTLVPALLEPSAAGSVQYRLVDQAGNPMVGQTIDVTAAGLSPASASGTTGPNGDFVFNYAAPATVGTYSISATAGGASDTQSVQVQTANTIPPVPAGTAITSASVSANPSVVGTNASGTGNRSDIRALFLTTGNVPIPNVRVRFDLDGDVNAIGGSFTTGSEILYADANGVVSSAYVPGSRSSPTNGVTIRTCYAKTDAELGTAAAPLCPNSTRTTLTVTSEPLGVSIGTNAQIIVNQLTYVKQFVVTVVDSAGVAKPDVNLVVSIDLVNYRKGAYAYNGTSWLKVQNFACLNEDTNRNGVREAGEDLDNDGRLDPGKSDVSISLVDAKTRADGTAVLQIQYAQSFGSWVDVMITVAASGVSGTEGRATYFVSPVPVDAASITNSTPPAFVVSPYGQAADCTDPN
jgi:hypothetical protein